MNRVPRTCHELGVCHGRKGLGCTCQHGAESLPRTSKAQGMLSALWGSDHTPVRSVGAT